MTSKGFINRSFFILLPTLFFVSCSMSEFSSSGCKNGICDGVSKQSFNWKKGGWEQCSRACGGGIRSRTVTCNDGEDSIVPNSECEGIKPRNQESCKPQACTDDFSWNIGPWSKCSKPCDGKKTRVAVCQSSSSGIFVDDSRCSNPKPARSKSCNKVCPPETYHWIPDSYNQPCNCGITKVTRVVNCRSTTTNILKDDSFCDPLTKPSTTKICPQNSCSTHSWVNGQWSACTKKCGDGTQTRSLGCIRDIDSVYTPHTLCDMSNKPTTQRACNTQACSPQCTRKTFTKQVERYNNQLDILLVVDDSGSMYKDSSRLARRLSGFVSRLGKSNINWQMCVTTTDVGYYQGRPIQWQGRNLNHILTKNSGNLNSIFIETMKFIGAGFSSDEQAIKAMNLSIQDKGNSRCHRDKADLVVIVISDEDERSVGGNRDLSPNDYKPLGTLNTPKSFIKTIGRSFSAGKRVTVNSIVVKDSRCQAQQNAQGERSFFGTKYMDLSRRTGGTIQSICINNYAIALDHFYERIFDNLGAVTLSCAPKNDYTVLVNNKNYKSFVTLSGNKLIFNPVVQGPATVSGDYCCK